MNLVQNLRILNVKKMFMKYCVTLIYLLWATIAQSASPHDTGWTVRGSNPGGGQDYPHSSRPTMGPCSILFLAVCNTQIHADVSGVLS
jgi:hypothetical protein